MPLNVGQQLSRLKRMHPSELREQYADVFGEASRSGNKDFLIKRIIWRMQSEEQGSLSERARHRATELARDADVRLRPPDRSPDRPPDRCHDDDERTDTTMSEAEAHDPRLPMPGALLTRKYKGRTINVRVLPKGFEYEGEMYRSLSAVARAVTGSHWNGYLFFNVPKEAIGVNST